MCPCSVLVLALLLAGLAASNAAPGDEQVLPTISYLNVANEQAPTYAAPLAANDQVLPSSYSNAAGSTITAQSEATSSSYTEASSTATTQEPSSCSTPGFYLKEKQEVVARGIGLYTLPGSAGKNDAPAPYPSWQAAAAACAADSKCAMFTGDGYLIGAFRVGSGGPKLNSEADMFGSYSMRFCAGQCCGTWVADGLLGAMREPVNRGDSSSRKVDAAAAPSDPLAYGVLEPISQQPVCAQKDDGGGSSGSNTQCPQWCIVACCAQLRAGDDAMGRYYFSQCSALTCCSLVAGDSSSTACGLQIRGKSLRGGTSSSGKVLLRQFTRGQVD